MLFEPQTQVDPQVGGGEVLPNGPQRPTVGSPGPRRAWAEGAYFLNFEDRLQPDREGTAQTQFTEVASEPTTLGAAVGDASGRVAVAKLRIEQPLGQGLGLSSAWNERTACKRSLLASLSAQNIMSNGKWAAGRCLVVGNTCNTLEVVVSKTFLDVRVEEEVRGLSRSTSWPCFQLPQAEVVELKGIAALKAAWDQDQKEKSLAEKDASHREGRCFPCLFFTRKGDGCRQGDSCTHCHICTIGEARRRRNRISLEMRKAKRQAKKMDLEA